MLRPEASQGRLVFLISGLPGDRLQISEMEESELVSNGVPQPLLKVAKSLYVEYFGLPRGPYGDKQLGTLARGVRRKCKKRSEATLIKEQRLATRRLSEKDTASGSMFGTRIPAEAKESCWSECHTKLHRALAEKQAAKVAEAAETRGQGLRPKTTAALKTKLQRGQRGRVTARQRRLLEKLSQPSKKPGLENARVYVLPKATANTELGPQQVLVDKVALADLVVVDNLNTPNWQTAEAMLRGKTICEGADVSKHKRICFAGAVQARSTQFLADDRVMFSMFIFTVRHY